MTRYLIDTAIEMAQLAAVLIGLAAVLAVAVGPRRAGRVLHAIIAVTRSHAPRWIVVVLNVALAIPGPVDEAIVLVIIAVMVWRLPVLRAAMVSAVRDAWHGRQAVDPATAWLDADGYCTAMSPDAGAYLCTVTGPHLTHVSTDPDGRPCDVMAFWSATAAPGTVAPVAVTITRRLHWATIGGKLAAAAIVAGLIVAPVAIAPTAAADGAASVIIGHARHRAATRPAHPVGCVDDHGRLVAPWPCHYVANADGSVDVYQP